MNRAAQPQSRRTASLRTRVIRKVVHGGSKGGSHTFGRASAGCAARLSRGSRALQVPRPRLAVRSPRQAPGASATACRASRRPDTVSSGGSVGAPRAAKPRVPAVGPESSAPLLPQSPRRLLLLHPPLLHPRRLVRRSHNECSYRLVQTQSYRAQSNEPRHGG